MSSPCAKRILMLLENCSYPQDIRVRHEAETLKEAGYQVTVICPKKGAQKWRTVITGVNVFRYPAPPAADGFLGYIIEYGYSLCAAFFLSLIVFLRTGFDIIHAHNPPDLFALIAAFYKLLGKKFIYDQHDLSPEMYFARFPDGGNQIVYRALLFFEWLSYRLADHVIATNESYKTIQMQRGKVSEKRITIVRNGPDLDKLPRTNGVKNNKKSKSTICYVGDMGFHDGVDYLLRSIRHLIHDLERTDFQCVLVGKGDAYDSLRALAKTLSITERVTFTGWVEHHEVAQYLKCAEICVAPEPSNNYNDRSTMIKMMEYMTFARPIVAFDLPEHRVTAGDAAVYAKPNDELDFTRKIAALMDEPEQGYKMGLIGRGRIESKLCWPHQANHLLKVYTKLKLE